MPKVTLQFTLPEEESDMLLAQRGSEFYCVIVDVINEIRNHNKYGKKMKEVFTEIERIVHDVNLEGIN